MKTVKKTATQAKTPRFVVSTPEGVELNASNKELAQQRVEELQSKFASSIYFVDHKQKEKWHYQREPNQKNYRVYQVTYTAPKVAVEAPVIES